MRGKPIRICLDYRCNPDYAGGNRLLLDVLADMGNGFPHYGGYLFRVSGNCFFIIKYGRPRRVLTFPELMGWCLGGRLSIDDPRWDMPVYYQNFI